MSREKRILKKDKDSEKQLNIFLDRFNEEFDKLENTNAKAFALESKISESSISNYKNKTIKSLPNMKTIENLARCFGVSSNYLLGKSDTPYYEHEDIMKKIGLSRKAYRILQSVKDTDLINTINYLIEQEEMYLFSGFSPVYDGKEDFNESLEKAIQSYEKEVEKVERNCIPILSAIHNFYSTKTTDEEIYIINGEFKRLNDFKYKINRHLASAKMSMNSIVEHTLLSEIENSLVTSKQKYKKRKESK